MGVGVDQTRLDRQVETQTWEDSILKKRLSRACMGTVPLTNPPKIVASDPARFGGMVPTARTGSKLWYQNVLRYHLLVVLQV